MKKIVVTGGAGFIGSHLCERLLKDNNKVICIDNLFTGSKDNLKDFLENDNFTFIEHDIVNPVLLVDQVDQIYNLACPASPIHYQYDPIKTVKANTAGVINMLDYANKIGARVLQTSTSEVYGNPLEHPQSEKYWGNVNMIGPRSCYDEGKRCAETLFFDYHRHFGLEIKIARVFNTYGPKMNLNDGRVVSNFIIQALQNKPITIYGDGSQTRSFCYVDDLVDGLIKLMGSFPDFLGPVNLGNPSEITIMEFAEKIIRLTNSKSKMEFKELPKDDPARRKPNIDLAKKELSWEPLVDIDEGLLKTIEYFKDKLKKEGLYGN